MSHKKLHSDHNIHALGIGYIYNYLNRDGYTIYEVNTDPNHYFQLFAKRNGDLFLLAIRTAFHPDIGTIDKPTHNRLIKESARLNATPQFASLSITSLSSNNMEIEGLTGGREYKVTLNEITVVDKLE